MTPDPTLTLTFVTAPGESLAQALSDVDHRFGVVSTVVRLGGSASGGHPDVAFTGPPVALMNLLDAYEGGTL